MAKGESERVDGTNSSLMSLSTVDDNKGMVTYWELTCRIMETATKFSLPTKITKKNNLNAKITL